MSRNQVSYYTLGKNTPAKLAGETGRTIETARNFLERQETYQRFKPVNYNTVRNYRIISFAPEWYWQADLADIAQWSRLNDGFKYILTVVDIFSKKAWATALKSKDAQTVADAMGKIFKLERVQGLKMKTDPGTEFKNSTLRGIEDDYNVVHTFSKPGIKTRRANEMGSIEAFNKTVKSALNQMMDSHDTNRWVDFLPQVIETYNNAKHSTTNQEPDRLHENLMAMEQERKRISEFQSIVNPGLRKGDQVRLLIKRGMFDKGTTAKWSKELFTISNLNPVMVYLQGKPDPYRFYEVQKVERVETIPDELHDAHNNLQQKTSAKTEREKQKLKVDNSEIITDKRVKKVRQLIDL